MNEEIRSEKLNLSYKKINVINDLNIMIKKEIWIVTQKKFYLAIVTNGPSSIICDSITLSKCRTTSALIKSIAKK